MKRAHRKSAQLEAVVPPPSAGLALLLVHALVVLTAMTAAPRHAHASVKVLEAEDRSLSLGIRLQPRLEYSHFPAAGGGNEAQRDFFIRRTRLRVAARLDRAGGFVEWRFDGLDQIGANPVASVEAAWIEYQFGDVLLRAGQYDQPFSRDRLTSYARQIAADRGIVSDVPTALGLADKAMGLEVSGQASGGHAVYTLGVFDNRTISGRLQDVPMIVGRLDLHLGSTQAVFEDAHFGDERWYSIGVNGSHQSSIEDGLGARDSTQAAAGVDGMIDVPLGGGRLLVRGELSAIRVGMADSDDEHNSTLRMIGAGFLTWGERLQPFVRFDQVRGDTWGPVEPTDLTFVGANLYVKRHAFKIQSDVRLEGGNGEAVDGVRLQAQLDF
jgi:hypothetical protein